MWTTVKVFIEFFLQYRFCFMFWFFGHETCAILAPRSGVKPLFPLLEAKVLTTGFPGKSLGTNMF